MIDAIWSIGVRYGYVGNVVGRYCTRLGLIGGLGRADGAGRVHGPAEFFADFGQCDGEALASQLFQNRQRTSSRGGVLKAEAVRQGLAVLDAAGIQTIDELVAQHDKDLKQQWLAIPGQRSGLSWRYLLMLAGVQEVKPDRMICRFVELALGRRVPPDEAGALLTAAAVELASRHDGLTVLGLDHLVWNAQSGRLAG